MTTRLTFFFTTLLTYATCTLINVPATLAAGMQITNNSLPSATVSTAYSAQLQANGGQPPYYWTIQGGTLPPGLLLDSTTGTISGTPKALGTWSFSVSVFDKGIDTLKAYKDFFIIVAQGGVSPPPPKPFDFTISANPSNITMDLTPLTLGMQPSISATTTVTVTKISGNIGSTVSLFLSGGVTTICNSLFDPPSGFGTFNSQLALTNSLGASTGTVTGLITATASGVTHSTPITLHILNNVPPGDLKLNSVAPVQVNYGPIPLTIGKNTIFKANISSTFTVPVTTEVELMLPATDWVWEGHNNVTPSVAVSIPASTGNTISPGVLWVPPYLSYVVSVTVPAKGSVDVVLPDPSALQSSSVQGYQIVYAPRPIHEGPRYVVRVNPGKKIAETDIKNNATHETHMVNGIPTEGIPQRYAIPSRELRILYALCLQDQGEMNSYYPGGWAGPLLANAYGDAKRLAEQASSHVLATYPIADEGKLRYEIPAAVLLYNPAPLHNLWGGNMLWNMTGYLDMLAKSWGYNRFVAIVPDNWLASKGQGGSTIGVTFDPCKSCFVKVGSVDKYPWVVTHEFLHILNYPDVYSPKYSLMANDGYWINKNVPISGSLSHNYMDYAKTNPPQWSTLLDYSEIISRTVASTDPKVLVFGAIVRKGDGVRLLPFQVVEGLVDPSEEDWNYAVVALNGAGKVLKENRLKVPFVAYVEPAGALPMDTAPVVSSVEWVDGIRAIEFRDKEGHTLARRNVSSHPPQVQLTSPRGGEIWGTGNQHPVTWKASDRDGDELYFTLAISNDRRVWTPIVMNVQGTQFKLDPGLFKPGGYYLKIRVTDGVNTGEDVSDKFELSVTGTPPPAKRLDLYVIALAALALIIIGLVVWLMRIRKRKRN